jgi:hypothetical protein
MRMGALPGPPTRAPRSIGLTDPGAPGRRARARAPLTDVRGAPVRPTPAHCATSRIEWNSIRSPWIPWLVR